MSPLPERSWKHRFAQHLVCAFVARGLRPDGALEDAIVHADDHYPTRGGNTPEQEAEALHQTLRDEMV